MLTKLPEIIVFAGPNGSGKSTITQYADIIPPYINADDIKRATHCSDMEAAQEAERLREKAVSEKTSFTFETVLSTERNLLLLEKAKKEGFFVRGYFVLTRSEIINVVRVKERAINGGHDVPTEKIISRYHKSLALLPRLAEVCDILHVYDNSEDVPVRIFKKRKDEQKYFPNEHWPQEKIKRLVSEETSGETNEFS